jgi:excisionase family DNA binding protein
MQTFDSMRGDARNLSPRKTRDNIEPLAVSPKAAGKLLSLSHKHVYTLLNSGELESYKEGKARRITMKSIHRHIAARLQQAREGG